MFKSYRREGDLYYTDIFIHIFNFSVNIEMFQKPANSLAITFLGDFNHILTVAFPMVWTNRRCFLRDTGMIFTNFLLSITAGNFMYGGKMR